MVIDLDYSLSWFLEGLAAAGGILAKMAFKGGTCLRKCYFDDYRFSEDIDFTAMQRITMAELRSAVGKAVEWISSRDGPDFQIRPFRMETVNDDYGKESFEVRLYYSGVLTYGGSPRTIRIEITRNEKVMFPLYKKKLIHPYSDRETFMQKLACYSLEEMLAEKTRALAGQRRYAISRDIYDIQQLIKADADVQRTHGALKEKFSVKGMDIKELQWERIARRRPAYEQDWKRKLSYLISEPQLDFNAAWTTLEKYIHEQCR